MKSRIPSGPSCFTPIYAPCTDGAFVYKVKHCPYWTLRSTNGIKVTCDYMKDTTESDRGLLLEQMKVCGINQ